MPTGIYKRTERHWEQIYKNLVNRDRRHSEATKIKIGLSNSIALKGNKLPKKVRIKIGKSNIGKHHNLKGNNVGYKAFHYRIKALKGTPEKCEICGTTNNKKSYDWANLTGQYKNPDDYKRMCRSCHWKFDKKINNIPSRRTIK